MSGLSRALQSASPSCPGPAPASLSSPLTCNYNMSPWLTRTCRPDQMMSMVRCRCAVSHAPATPPPGHHCLLSTAPCAPGKPVVTFLHNHCPGSCPYRPYRPYCPYCPYCPCWPYCSYYPIHPGHTVYHGLCHPCSLYFDNQSELQCSDCSVRIQFKFTFEKKAEKLIGT